MNNFASLVLSQMWSDSPGPACFVIIQVYINAPYATATRLMIARKLLKRLISTSPFTLWTTTKIFLPFLS